MSFEMDDGTRPALGVVVSWMDRGDGRNRPILDDVRSRTSTAWDFDAFYAHQSHNNVDLDDTALTDDEYRDIGVALVARLLALNGRVR
jgi:hypothetical protein